MGFPGDTRGKEPTCQCRRHKRREFDPWVAKIPWSRERLPAPVFWPGEFYIVYGVAQSWTQMSDFHFHDCENKEMIAREKRCGKVLEGKN